MKRLFIENKEGVRYLVRVGFAYQMSVPMSVDANLLLSMFDDKVIQDIHREFFGPDGFSCNTLSISIQSSNTGTVFLGPLSEAPAYLSSRARDIYIALIQNRLIIEEDINDLWEIEQERLRLISELRAEFQKIIASEEAHKAEIESLLQSRLRILGQRQFTDTSDLQGKVLSVVEGVAREYASDWIYKAVAAELAKNGFVDAANDVTEYAEGAWDTTVDTAKWVWNSPDEALKLGVNIVEMAASWQTVWHQLPGYLGQTAAANLFLRGEQKAAALKYLDTNLNQAFKETADVLGYDIRHVAKEVTEEAFQIAEAIYDDQRMRAEISRFLQAYVRAQHPLEIAEWAGGKLFEFIVAVVIAFLTGGTAAAVAAVNQPALMLANGYKKIGHIFKRISDLLKKQSLRKLRRPSGAKGAKFSDLSSSEAATPPSSNGPSSSSSSSNSSSKGSQSNQSSSSGSSTNNGGQTGGSSASNQPDKTSSETGNNQNKKTSQSNSNAVEGGDPINLKTGEERLTLVDTVLDGPLPLTVARTYRSSNPKDFGMGHGWTHTLGEKLLWRPGKAVQLHDAEGRVINLPAPGDSGRSHNVVEQLTLTRVNDEHWIVTPYGAPNGVQRHFKAIGDKGTLKLAEIRDGYGNFYLFHYIDERLICIESSLGEALHISPPEGQAKSLHIGELKKETRDGRIKVLAKYEYNNEGDLIKATDADGHSEQYQYHQHVIKQRTLKTGYRFHFEWDAEGPSARCVRQWGDPIDGQDTYNYQFAWDDDGKGVSVTDTRGGKERYRFNERALPIYHCDPEGAETLYSYNDLGQITKVQLPSDDGSLREEIYQYDDQGRLVQKTDAAGNKHRIEYNREGLPAKVIDPAGNKWQREYNKKGQIAATKDPLGNSTQYGYNPVGLIGSVTDPLGNTTRYLWNPEGKLAAVKDPMGRAQHYRYDSARRLEEVQHAPGQVTRYEYDAQDRIHAVITPDGARIQYSYNPQGLLAEVTDSEGRSTCYAYDGLSQVKARTNPDGSRLQYHYDGERNLVGLTNENGEHYQLKYDLNERLIEEVGFDGRVTRYAYNRAGHLISSRAVTDTDSGKGIDTIFERDPFGRLLEEVSPDGITNFRYNRSGQLIEAENTHCKLRWEYDANGRVVADWQGKDKLSHQYDAVGNRIATTLPDGEVLNFAFNPAGQFQSLHRCPVGGDIDQLITSISHDEQGRESQRQHGNGLESQRDYDPQGRLQKLRLGKANGPVSDPTQSNSILERSYQYNKAGQIAQIEDSLRGNRSYHYDALDRLTQVDGPNPEYFVHDPAHNILAAANSKDEAKQQASVTQVKGNRLALRGDTHYRYDIHGNRIAELRGKGQKLQTRYHYNSRQQLVRVEKLKVEEGAEQLQQEIHYQYDPLGRRIGKASSDEQTGFLWDGDVLLRENKTDTQTKQDINTRTYYFEPGTFKPVGLKEDNQVYHYHLDHLGTPDTLTNQDGEVVWSVAYKCYGNIALAHENQIEQPIRFQGQYFDEETGLHYNRFRYYDPQIGEFTQQDPIGLLGGVNNYQYVPNPVKWIDPFGLSAKPGDCNKNGPIKVDPLLEKHLQALPEGSYEIIEQVDRPGQGFTGDKAVKIKLLDTVEGHRFSGGGSNPAGPYVAIGDMPSSRYETRQLLALKSFGRGAYNDMTHYTSVTMEKGTTLYIGEVAPQVSKAGTKYRGGGTQVFAEFWQPENAGKISFSTPKKMPRKKISTKK
ncbi:RHS repeat-associated core domain-containing protein [Microbulbifer sp. DLAB2-AF]|uniref:RHS repeat-associated core domain-containing protein n=1 Tax=Microbulbifer sp. DLAB2-AF TaxID=3243395 RepID=UPI0040390313